MSFKAFITHRWSDGLRKFCAVSLGILLSVLSGYAVNAQGKEDVAGPSSAGIESNVTMFIALCILLLVAVLVLITCLYALYALNLILGKEREKAGSEASEGFWSRINRKFGAGELLPVSREEEIMMDHSYDGISELNNHMPPWLKYLFYATIIFAVVYTVNYLVLDTGKSQIEEYHEELAEAERQAEEQKLLAGNSIDESSVVFTTEAAHLENGKKIYADNCSACHRADGGGSVGPNLTDEYWLHGGSIQDVFKVIKYGVQEKGMIPWQDKLTPEDIQNVASFILTLQGTAPEGAKEPQGEKYEDKGTVSSL